MEDLNRRQRSFRLEAVVLRHQDYGEADRLLVLFSREMGKLHAIAKGVRRPRSRKAGHVEPYTRSSLQMARGRDMLIITQAETLDAYTSLRDDLLRATYAAYIIELLDRFTYEEGENRALYRLLVETLERLSAGVRLDLVVRYYEMRLLDQAGFRPQLFHCARCEAEILPQDQYFSAEWGGVLCPKCGREVPSARPISTNALRYLRHLQRSTFAEAERAQPSPENFREMEGLVQYYITYVLERGLNTPAFLRRVRKG
jgi:DNA repair protein RecO (recombination protein O)